MVIFCHHQIWDEDKLTAHELVGTLNPYDYSRLPTTGSSGKGKVMWVNLYGPPHTNG